MTRLRLAMTLAEAKNIAGNLGHPSKMPGYSYGLDARRCRTGNVLAGKPGSVCSSCYARNAFYATWVPLSKGHAKRHDGLEHPRWCDAMVSLVEHYCAPPQNFFRWHDSGDLQDALHFAKIIEVCSRTPAVSHWLPTREYHIVADVLRSGVRIPENLCVRLSAHMIDTEPVIPDELRDVLADLPTSTVHTCHGHPVITPRERKGAIECIAVEARDNICGPCRACWSRAVVNVSYPQH